MARVVSTLLFWLLMIPMILGSLVFVIVVYFPFVALKAVYLGLTGQIEKTTSGQTEPTNSAPPLRPG